MSADERVVHLAGYAAITGILGTATWASQEGQFVAFVFAVFVVGYGAIQVIGGLTSDQPGGSEEGESA